LILVVIAAYCIATTRGGSVVSPENYIVKQAAVPADSTVYWIDSDNGRVYTYYAGEWLGSVREYVFGKGASGITGALNICGVAACPSDTTTDAEQGYFMPNRMRITEVRALCNDAIAPACTLQVFSDRLLYQYVWNSQKQNFTVGANDTVGAGDVLGSYVLAALIPQNPDTVTVVVSLRERVAP
jgi:hypothetical protein